MKALPMAILAAALLVAPAAPAAPPAAPSLPVAAPPPAATASAPPPPASPSVGVHVAPPPPTAYTYRSPVIIPTIGWVAAQAVPSPELVVGRQSTHGLDGTSGAGATWGLRWQITPLLWSWGVHRRQSPWRLLVVDPLARISGSVELSTAIEYVGGQIDRPLIRPGVRTYLPLVDRGEFLALSLGTSIYRYDAALRVAYSAGLYVLSGMVGIDVSIAPTHAPMASIFTLNLRYF